MKEIWKNIYYIFSFCLLLYWIFVIFFGLIWCISLDFDLIPITNTEIILYIIDIVIYFLVLILSIILKIHSSNLLKNKKLTFEKKILLFLYILFVLIISILNYFIQSYHFSHIALGVLVTCNV